MFSSLSGAISINLATAAATALAMVHDADAPDAAAPGRVDASAAIVVDRRRRLARAPAAAAHVDQGQSL